MTENHQVIQRHMWIIRYKKHNERKIEFTNDCGSNYIGRTERMLKTRVGEHIPEWLENQINSPYPIDWNGRHPALLNILSRQVIRWMSIIHSKWFTRAKGGGCFDLLRHWLFEDWTPPPPLCPKAVYFLIETPLVLISLDRMLFLCPLTFGISVSKFLHYFLFISHVRMWNRMCEMFSVNSSHKINPFRLLIIWSKLRSNAYPINPGKFPEYLLKPTT